MVSAMSVEAWRRHCDEAREVVARVASGLHRRSSECVSDMVSCRVVWTGLFLQAARATPTSMFRLLEKLLSTGH